MKTIDKDTITVVAILMTEGYFSEPNGFHSPTCWHNFRTLEREYKFKEKYYKGALFDTAISNSVICLYKENPTQVTVGKGFPKSRKDQLIQAIRVIDPNAEITFKH